MPTETTAGATPGEAPPHFDTIDGVYATLRAVAVLLGAAYTWMSPSAAPVRHELTVAFGVFAAYTAVVYFGGWTLFQTRMKPRFYVTTAALDFLFLVVVLLMTDGGTSPMYRALYVWVAMLAFYFGQPGGNWASAVAFVVFVWLFWADGDPPDVWNLGTKAGGLLLHGPLIGWLVDRERRRASELREALARLQERR